jgi:hypothetical protein
MTRAELQSRIDGNERVIELGEVTVDIDDSLTIPAGRAPLTIRGKGKEGTIFRVGSSLIHSDGVTVRLHDMGVVAQVPHAGIVLELTGGGADLEATGCLFKDFYDGLWGQWAGGMLRVAGCEFRNFARHAIYGESNVGYWVARIVDSYFDGRESEGLISLNGSHAGGVIANNYMQASQVHIDIDAAGTAPVGELVIGKNMLDQDSASIAAIRIRGNGQPYEGASSNCIKVTGNYINSVSRALLMNDPANVFVGGNSIRWSGDSPAIDVLGGRAAEVSLETNGIQYWGGSAPAAIRWAPTSSEGGRIKGNYGRAFNGQLPYLTVNGNIKDLAISDNSPGPGYSQLVARTWPSGNGEVICRGNTPYNSPYLQATVSGPEMVLPIADESQVVGVGTIGQITHIVGVTARQGVRVTLLSATPVQFRQPAAMVDGAVGVDFDLEPFKPRQVLKFQDNHWYPL